MAESLLFTIGKKFSDKNKQKDNSERVVHGSRVRLHALDENILQATNFNVQFSLFINNMFVTLLSSTCFEHSHAHLQEEKLYSHTIWYRHSL